MQTLDRGTVVVLDRNVRSADPTGVEHGDELLMRYKVEKHTFQ